MTRHYLMGLWAFMETFCLTIWRYQVKAVPLKAVPLQSESLVVPDVSQTIRCRSFIGVLILFVISVQNYTKPANCATILIITCSFNVLIVL